MSLSGAIGLGARPRTKTSPASYLSPRAHPGHRYQSCRPGRPIVSTVCLTSNVTLLPSGVATQWMILHANRAHPNVELVSLNSQLCKFARARRIVSNLLPVRGSETQQAIVERNSARGSQRLVRWWIATSLNSSPLSGSHSVRQDVSVFVHVQSAGDGEGKMESVDNERDVGRGQRGRWKQQGP